MLATRHSDILCLSTGARTASSKAQEPKSTSVPKEETEPAQDHSPTKQRKTSAQLDEEMRQAMEGIAGDGGEAGLELEEGRPVSMKRGVRDNMFRYI